MKTLKLDHELAELVRTGKKTSTWRLFDDKNLSVNDEVILVDKVNPDDVTSWKAFGTATIHKILQTRMGDISPEETYGHETIASEEDMLRKYQRYYGPEVTLRTPVKLVYFTFSPQINSDASSNLLSSINKVIIYADGASRGNPGPSASGYVIYNDSEEVLIKRGSYLGVTTNNQAEYAALRTALEEAKRLGARDVSVYMDSMLVINQMKGIFKVKNRELWPVHEALKKICEGFTHISFTQIPRELNKAADQTANDILDKQQLLGG